jgi:hypothetical protein
MRYAKLYVLGGEGITIVDSVPASGPVRWAMEARASIQTEEEAVKFAGKDQIPLALTAHDIHLGTSGSQDLLLLLPELRKFDPCQRRLILRTSSLLVDRAWLAAIIKYERDNRR